MILLEGGVLMKNIKFEIKEYFSEQFLVLFWRTIKFLIVYTLIFLILKLCLTYAIPFVIAFVIAFILGLIAQANSKNKIKVTDIMSFPWEKIGNKENQKVTDEQIEQLAR